MFLAAQNHGVEQVKVGFRARALQPAQNVGGFRRPDLRQQAREDVGGVAEGGLVHAGLVVAQGALKAPAGVGELSENHRAGDFEGARRVVGNTVLFAAQQNVSVRDSRDAG